MASDEQFRSEDGQPTLDGMAWPPALSTRYEILAEAGRGGMGTVYKAVDRETRETVAVKVLHPSIASGETAMERFRTELRLAHKITHRNVCRIFDFNRTSGLAYISMEFVEGETLRERLKREGRLTVAEARPLMSQICAGLREAHAQGVVHR